MVTRLQVESPSREALIDITPQVNRVVAETGIPDGICYLYVPHTTAGIIINESADPDVGQDILARLSKLVPNDIPYQHAEGNAPAHIKATLVGTSQAVPVQGGGLALGTWQGVFLCEFDGPRTRTVIVQVMGDRAG